jgi:hypothetical protein
MNVASKPAYDSMPNSEGGDHEHEEDYENDEFDGAAESVDVTPIGRAAVVNIGQGSSRDSVRL